MSAVGLNTTIIFMYIIFTILQSALSQTWQSGNSSVGVVCHNHHFQLKINGESQLRKITVVT